MSGLAWFAAGAVGLAWLMFALAAALMAAKGVTVRRSLAWWALVLLMLPVSWWMLLVAMFVNFLPGSVAAERAKLEAELKARMRAANAAIAEEARRAAMREGGGDV